MTVRPVVNPDGAKIGQLIKESGYSRADFARKLRLIQVRTLYNLIYTSRPTWTRAVEEIADVLGVSYEEIILGDDAEPEALAS